MPAHGFVTLAIDGVALRIEHAWIAPERRDAPLLVFLHEGLGSVSMWRDFPERLCHALGVRGLVYSRPGYGRSTPRAHNETWAPDFMHRHAHVVMPALFEALAIDDQAQPPWLFGHSDGGSIALLHAARFPDRVAGAIVMAPHVIVEPVSVTSIQAARHAYLTTDLRTRLARHHDDPDSAFWGWNDVWLSSAFRSWSIVDELPQIRCPVLAMQGVDDEYGTLEQIHLVGRHVPGARECVLQDCAHSPHRDQPDAVIAATRDFVFADEQGGGSHHPYARA